MPFKAVLFAGLFAFCAIGALSNPIWGILGYVGHYCVGPENQWWSAPLRPLGLRYSLILGVMTLLGFAIHRRRLCDGKLLMGQEKLVLLFLAMVWVGSGG